VLLYGRRRWTAGAIRSGQRSPSLLPSGHSKDTGRQALAAVYLVVVRRERACGHGAGSDDSPIAPDPTKQLRAHTRAQIKQRSRFEEEVRMATPWSTSRKLIGITVSTGAPPTSGPSTGFVPPTVPSVLRASPIPFFAATAKMQALRTATASIAAALARAATALTEAIVDDATAAFLLDADAETIEPTARTALAGAVGAGVCHLVMVSMGYVWNDHAHRIISASPLADFAYDGGPASGHGLVLAEAKGSFSQKVTQIWVQRKSEGAYDRQVHPHVLHPWRSPAVVHGYAVKLGAQLASVRKPPGPHSFIHVTETPRASAPPKRGLSVGISSETAMAVTSVALGNYRAAFMLAGAPVVVRCIDSLGGDEKVEGEQLFELLSTPSGDFIAGASGGDGGPFGVAGRRFAIRKDIAEAFLTKLSDLFRGWVPRPLWLPVVPYSGDGFHDDFIFPDGLALVTCQPRSGTARWSPAGGYSE